MPPKPKTEAQLQIDREKIISASLNIISANGLDGLTMRKLASTLHMSAANMYNYFYNKDEIYLHILITGFDLLYKTFLEAIEKYDKPIEKLEHYMRAFIKFGMQYSSYYELMFSTKDPKSMDYIDSPMEQLANKEKAHSMRLQNLTTALLKECLPSKPDSELYTVATRIFCELHGCINLYHSNVLKELGNNIDDIAESIVIHIITDIKAQA